MKYLLLIYEAEDIWDNMSDAERVKVLDKHSSLHGHMAEQGIEYIGQPLMPTSTALSVRVRDDGLSVSDGPFAETKEQLAGFYLVTVDDVDTAVDLASRLQEASLGCVEVRPVADHGEYVE